jgi:hypothetical protein
VPTCRRFLQGWRGGFLGHSLATQLFAKLATGIDTLEGLTEAQTSGGGEAREATATRGEEEEEN